MSGKLAEFICRWMKNELSPGGQTGNYRRDVALSQIMVIVGRSAVIVVDAPPSIGMDLNAGPFGSDVNVTIPEIVAEITDKPITKLIYSHSHFDHIGAAGVIKEAFPDVLIIAHKLTKEQLEFGSRNPNFVQLRPMIPLPDVPLPDTIIGKSRKLALGKDSDVRIDLNMLWSEAEALKLMSDYSSAGMRSFEQPLPAEQLQEMAVLVE